MAGSVPVSASDELPRAKSGAVDPVAGSLVYPIGSAINSAGHLEIGGCDAVELAREFGTPAYVYAPDDIRARARSYLEAFRSRKVEHEVLYASKAAPITEVYGLCREEGLSVDVASGGELHMALRAGFTPERIYMHGNNKSAAELSFAFDRGWRRSWSTRTTRSRSPTRCSIDPRTSSSGSPRGSGPPPTPTCRRSRIASKFGFGLADGRALAAAAVRDSRNLRLAGFHAHIGSQIFELEPYVRAIEVLADFSRDLEPRMLNVGGGLGIADTAADEPPPVSAYVDVKVEGIRRFFDPLPKIAIDPGRSLVGNAGVPLYGVGTVKEVPGVRTYVSVDGGMSDNLRPMLYGSRYDATIADRAADAPDRRVTSSTASRPVPRERRGNWVRREFPAA